MDNILLQIANNLHQHLENELERLDNLEQADLNALRLQRMNEMKSRAIKKQEWLANGHGEYTELSDEKEFFAACQKSENVVCHFYRFDAPRCRIVDMHLMLLAQQHLETRFIKINAERSPFLSERLKIRMLPTIALVKNNKTKDFIVGFTDLGNRDNFSTEMMEWRLARSDMIEYSGDLTVPPAEARKQRSFVVENKKTVRGRPEDADSDLDLSD